MRTITTSRHYHHVTVDGTGTKSYSTPALYNRDVLRQLEKIHHSHTGQAVFHEFQNRSSHLLKIIPYEGTQLNAFASAVDYRHATRKGAVERSGADGSVLHDSHGKTIVGLGGGSNAEISFTPIKYTRYCRQNKAHKAGAQPDEVLFHEMTHATREMRGIFNPLPLGFMYDTEEEFFAIVMQNIYASETGRPYDIRESHHGREHLTTDTNATFLPKADMTDYRYRLVAKLVHQEPKMCRELVRVHAHFNPIRRYFELQRTLIFIPRHPIHRLPRPPVPILQPQHP
jgi:hypothetical protein